MTPAAALARIAAEATPEQGDSIAIRLLGCAAALGKGVEPDAVGPAAEAIGALQGWIRLHSDALDPDAVHGPSRAGADPPSGAVAGAWLLGRGSERIAACGDAATAAWTRAARAVASAQVIEFDDLYDAGRAPQRALAAAEARSGAVLGLCGRLGALLADAPEGSIEAAGRFGTELGVAVEIHDELAAVRRAREQGHPRPAFAAGRYPLALLYALQNDPGIAARLGRPLADEEIAAAVDAIEAAGGLRRAEQERGARIAAARAALEGLDAEPLLELADEAAG